MLPRSISGYGNPACAACASAEAVAFRLTTQEPP